MKKLKNTGAYAYLFPSFLIFGIFLFYPFFKTLYLSLFKTNKMGQAKLFVGLGNYKELLLSSSFWNSLAVTLIFVVIVVAVSMILGLTTAVLCNKTFPGIRFSVLHMHSQWQSHLVQQQLSSRSCFIHP